MKADCESFREWVKSFSLINSCEVLPSGYLRLATPFIYPDGSTIDVFYNPDGELFTDGHFTDLGQTSAYLADLHIFPHEHPKRNRIIDQVCAAFGAENNDGEFRIKVPNIHSDQAAFQRAVPNAIFRLGHVCARAADVSFTKKFKLASGFNDTVGTYLNVATDVRFETNVKVPGLYDKPVRVDFRTAKSNTQNLVLTISPETIAGAHSASTEVFSKWNFLDRQKAIYGFITLLDTQAVRPRDEDIKQLEEKSKIITFPDQRDAFLELLTA